MQGRRALPVIGLAAASALVAWFIGSSPPPARAEGVAWSDEAFDAVLERAARANQRVLVKFDATWCTVCRQLEREVLDTADGAELTEDLIAIRVDFDDPDNRPLVERFVVMGLPTVLVLTPDGVQVGRIQGYESREAWLEQARAARTAEDPLPDLRAAYERAPDDAARMRELGEALLVRGDPDGGVELLERAALTDGDDAAEALFLLGRYHHRVRRDPATARPLWRELALRFPDGAYTAGAYYWYARAEVELGHEAQALYALNRYADARPEDPAAAALVLELIADQELDVDPEPAAARLRERLRFVDDPEERAELESLAAGDEE